MHMEALRRYFSFSMSAQKGGDSLLIVWPPVCFGEDGGT